MKFNKRKACRNIVEDLTKHSQHVQDAGAEIVRIKETIRESSFKVKLTLVTKNKKKTQHFSKNLSLA